MQPVPAQLLLLHWLMFDGAPAFCMLLLLLHMEIRHAFGPLRVRSCFQLGSAMPITILVYTVTTTM